MSAAPALSVVIAVKDAEANLDRILNVISAHSGEDIEFIFCVAGDWSPTLAATALPARVSYAEEDSLVPHLWRDGILMARGDKVALTTAHCIPTEQWLDRALHADTARFPGVGGLIDNDPQASAANWAIFFLRYLAFAPQRTASVVRDIAADNAVYSRTAIMAHRDLLGDGFWEPSFHRRFHADGKALFLDPSMIVIHHGLNDPREFVRHRYAHGTEYGGSRALERGIAARIGFLLASPAVPALIVARIVGRLTGRRDYSRHFPRALPWLVCMASAWGLGEAAGYWRALWGRK